MEWLLIVSAIAALAATSVLVVQGVLDRTAAAPTDPDTRMIEAHIEALLIEDQAQATYNEQKSAYTDLVDRPFRRRCWKELPAAFGDILVSRSAADDHWKGPHEPRRDSHDPPKGWAKCTVIPK